MLMLEFKHDETFAQLKDILFILFDIILCVKVLLFLPTLERIMPKKSVGGKESGQQEFSAG
ncbi:MAG: hypothetical protein WCL46_08665 [Chlorobium sp.]